MWRAIRFANRFEKGAHFVLLAADLQFNTASARLRTQPVTSKPLAICSPTSESQHPGHCLRKKPAGCITHPKIDLACAPAATVRCVCIAQERARAARTGGRSSGGGTRRGSAEFRLNCSARAARRAGRERDRFRGGNRRQKVRRRRAECLRLRRNPVRRSRRLRLCSSRTRDGSASRAYPSAAFCRGRGPACGP